MKGQYYIKVTNNLQGFKNLMRWLKELGIKQANVHVCMEHTGAYGYDIALFMEKKGICYSMVHALAIKRSSGMTRGKNDKLDAKRIAVFAYRFRDELTPTKLKDSSLIKLRDLINDRKLFVKHCAAYKTVLSEHKNHPESKRYKRAVDMISTMNAAIADIEEEIESLIDSVASIKTNYELLMSIKGIGMVNAVNTIISTSNFTGFKNARQYASYCGIAPFEFNWYGERCKHNNIHIKFHGIQECQTVCLILRDSPL